MKSEIYNALAAINRGFDVMLESLTILETEGLLSADYLQQQREIAEEVRAGLNHTVLGKMLVREEDDWAHFGKMRVATEARLKTTMPG